MALLRAVVVEKIVREINFWVKLFLLLGISPFVLFDTKKWATIITMALVKLLQWIQLLPPQRLG